MSQDLSRELDPGSLLLVDLVKASKFSHGVFVQCSSSPHPCLKSLTRNLPSLDTWDREVGPGREEGWDQTFWRLWPWGSSGSILQCCVDMAVPTPTTCLRPPGTQRPSPRKRQSGSRSVTVTQALRPEAEEPCNCSAFCAPAGSVCTIDVLSVT